MLKGETPVQTLQQKQDINIDIEFILELYFA